MEQVFDTLETSDISMMTIIYNTMIDPRFSIETFETPLTIIIVQTRVTTHRNIQAVIVNPYDTTNQENSHLRT